MSFASTSLQTAMRRFSNGVRAHRAGLKRPPMTPALYIAQLAEITLGMPEFAEALGFHQDVLER